MPTNIELRLSTHSLMGKNSKELRQGDILMALNSICENFKTEGVKLDINKDTQKQISFNILQAIKTHKDLSEINKKFTIKIGVFYDSDKKKFLLATVNVTIPNNKESIYKYSSSDYNAKMIKEKEKPIILSEENLKQKAIAKN